MPVLLQAKAHHKDGRVDEFPVDSSQAEADAVFFLNTHDSVYLVNLYRNCGECGSFTKLVGSVLRNDDGSFQKSLQGVPL